MSKKPEIDFTYIRDEIKRMDPKLSQEDPAFQIAVALLASSQTGANADKLAKFMGCTRVEGRAYGAKFRSTGLWRGRKIDHSGWFDADGGGVSFWCDVMVAQGLLRRSRSDARSAP